MDVYYSTSKDTVQSAKTDSGAWKSADAHKDFGTKQVTSLNFGAIDARYILIVFNISKTGNISPHCRLIGTITTANGTAIAPKQQKSIKPGESGMVNDEDLVEFELRQVSAFGTKVTHLDRRRSQRSAKPLSAATPAKN